MSAKKLSKGAVKMGSVVLVENQERHQNANETYLSCKLQAPYAKVFLPSGVILKEGNEFYALFTAHELDRAIQRANTNKEDLAKPSLLNNLLD